MKAEAGRLAGIDLLRAVGALLVLMQHGLWAHLYGAFQERGLFWVTYPFTQGFVGVHLFLVVSGFCIHARAAREEEVRAPGFLPFWRRRLLRLYPPYLMAVAVSLLLLLALRAAGGGAGRGAEGPAAGPELYAWAGLVHLFMAFPLWERALSLFGNGVFWTLALEEQLYLFYFGVPWLRRRLGMERTLLAAFLVTVLWRVLVVFGPLGHHDALMPPEARVPATHLAEVHWLTLAPARWFEWMLGAMAVELAVGRTRRRPLYGSVPLALLAAGGALACQWFRLGLLFTDMLWGVAFFVVVNRVVEREQAGKLIARGPVAALARIGVWSYSLYLVHVPLLALLHHFLVPALPGWISLPLAMLLVLPPAWLFYHLFERPAIRWARSSAVLSAARS